MRRLLISSIAFLVPLSIWSGLLFITPVFQFPYRDLLIGNWNPLGFGWKSLGTPIRSIGVNDAAQAQSIVSITAGYYDIYVSTSDKRIFAQHYMGVNTPVWEEIKDATIRFNQPPQLFTACYFWAADGEKLYSYDYPRHAVDHALIGPIRGS